MNRPRQTFIVTIRSGSAAVVENVATGERRPIEDLTEIAAQIVAWQRGAQRSEPRPDAGEGAAGRAIPS